MVVFLSPISIYNASEGKKKKSLTSYIFLNKYNHTINTKAFKTLPFPALISLLAQEYSQKLWI